MGEPHLPAPNVSPSGCDPSVHKTALKNVAGPLTGLQATHAERVSMVSSVLLPAIAITNADVRALVDVHERQAFVAWLCLSIRWHERYTLPWPRAVGRIA